VPAAGLLASPLLGPPAWDEGYSLQQLLGLPQSPPQPASNQQQQRQQQQQWPGL
jgi:hypothetical protein